MKKCNSTSVFSNRGFSLIEILIAITLLAFITMGVVSITQNAANTMERTTEANENSLQIETALSRFEWDFSQIYTPLYFSTVLNTASADPYGNPNDQDQDGLDDKTRKPIEKSLAQQNPQLAEYYQLLVHRYERNEHFSGVSKEGLPIPRLYSPERNIFEFFTSSNRRKTENVKQSHFAWVRYSLGEALPLEEGEEKNTNIPPGLKTFVRYFSADNPYDMKRLNIENTEQVKKAVLLENVESLQFFFWDMDRKRWSDSLRTIVNGEALIRGVKLAITWYDSTGNKRTAERIYRNPWPMVVPNDITATPAPGTVTNGTPSGTTK